MEQNFCDYRIETPSDIVVINNLPTKADIRCETLNAGNYDAAAEIFYSCYCHDPKKVEQFILPHMKMCLDNPQMFPFMPEFILSYYEGEPAGIAAYSMSHFSPMIWEFLWGCVKTEYQGKGLGSVMVTERCERIAKHAKTDEAFAVIRVMPSPMYLKAGFNQCTQMGEDGKWLMWKKVK